MDPRVVTGRILSCVGNQLQDKNSDIYNNIELSDKQLLTMFNLFHIIASPSVQVSYISDIAMRWKVTNRTIQNWLHDKIIPTGRVTEGDTRMHWLGTEIDDIEDDLIKRGYIKKEKLGKKEKEMVLRLQDFL